MRQPQRTTELFIRVALLGIIGLTGCAMRDGDKQSRNNPYDINGGNFEYDKAPVITGIPSSTPLWTDYDFDAGRGTLELSFAVSDSNRPYDTIHAIVLAGASSGALDTIYHGTDSAVDLPGVAASQQIFYGLHVTDRFDSAADTAGSMTAPSGVPPNPPTTVLITYNSYSSTPGLQLAWSTYGAVTGYGIYRSDSVGTRFKRIALPGSSTTQYLDNVPGHRLYAYLISAANVSGEARSKDTLYGWIPSSSVPSVYSLSASQGNDTRSISISWDLYESSGIAASRIFRSRTYGGNYQLIATIPGTGTEYRDMTIHDTGTYYYKVAAFDGQGQGGELSSYASGYLWKITPPSWVSASEGSYSDYILVSWASVPQASGYYVFRSTSSYGAYVIIDSTASTSYSDRSISDASTYYYYKISSRDSTGSAGTLSEYTSGYLKALSAPYNLSATGNANFVYVKLTWTGVSGAAGYNIYRSISYSGTYEKIGSSSLTSYQDTLALGGTTFYYKVSAVDASGHSGTLSDYTTGSLLSPGTVTGLVVSDGTYPNRITLVWNAVTGSPSFRIYRASNSSVGAFLVTYTTASTAFTDSAVSGDSVYYYKVSACVGTNSGPLTSPVLGRSMYRVTNLTVTSDSDCVKIGWTQPAYATAFQLYRSGSTDTVFAKIAELTTSTTIYRDSVDDLASHWYRITASNTNGTSQPSAALKSGRIPRAPTNLHSRDSLGSARLWWSPSTGATSYVIHRRTSASSPSAYAVIDTVQDTTFKISDASGNRYYYEISAFNANGPSGTNSNEVLTGALIVPGIPKSVTAQGTVGCVILTWTAGTDGSPGDVYYIYRRLVPDSGYVKLDSTASTSYNDSLAGTLSHDYQISARNVLGEGPRSLAVSGNRIAPAAVSGLSATDAEYARTVKLVWRRSPGAAGYRVNRAVASSASQTILDSTSDSTFTDSSAHSDTTYNYWVGVFNDVGSTFAGPVTGSVLSPPKSVNAVGNQTFITVTWDTSHKALGYILYRGTSPAGPYSRIDSQSTLMYRDTVHTVARYYYKVSAYRTDESVLSAPSAAAQRTLPAMPLLVSASQGALTDSVKLNWQASAGATGYRVYRSSDSLFTNPLLRLTSGTTTDDDTVTSDSLFYYRVKAFTDVGESVLSNELSGFRRPSIPPDTVTLLTATDSVSSSINLSWNHPVSGAQVNGYRIFRSTTLNGTYDLVDSTLQTTFQDYVPLTFPTYYWYKIKAYNSAGDGVLSRAASGTRR